MLFGGYSWWSLVRLDVYAMHESCFPPDALQSDRIGMGALFYSCYDHVRVP